VLNARNSASVISPLATQVFDKFVKADTTQADGGHGTGLGLTIAKGIMEAHGGAIAAESPPADGRGTRIILTFPSQDVPA
jgi:two-component system sensor histidine kinase KdpD